MKITRREFGASVGGAMAAAAASLGAQTPAPRAPALDIADWSYFWYGVERATLARGTVVNGSQMFVERWIPADVRHPYPVVLIHGGYGQGSDWLSTPGGQRGWTTRFLEAGYKVYVLDRPGQGRNPYQPFIHGLFDAQSPTFEKVAAEMKRDVDDPQVAQVVASMNQPMANNAVTQELYRSRGTMLLEDIGPSILVTHADGAAFAWRIVQTRPSLVKGLVTVARPNVDIYLGAESRAIPMMSIPTRDDVQPVLDWMKSIDSAVAPSVRKAGDANESTALKLADQGCFWVGIRKKTMPYGTIPQGQMFVQYMIPAERRHPYPVILIHGGGAQGTHMMGLGGRPGWVHYFVRAGYAVYWLDRPSFGRSPYHPDALGPSHLNNVPPYEALINATNVFKTAQWPGPGGMDDPFIGQFMACESGNTSDEAFHSDLVWDGGVELVDRIGPCIIHGHAFGGFFGWGVADRRPSLVKAIVCMEINGNPFERQLRWGLTAQPMTYDPPVSSLADFRLVDRRTPPDSPRPFEPTFKLQAEPARQWKNLKGIPIGWMTSEDGAGGSPVANVEFLKQVGCSVEMLRLRDHGITGNGNLMLMEKNNREVFGVLSEWLAKQQM
jgi:pimeloyl-ACP methyl ester carboxylesterase